MRQTPLFNVVIILVLLFTPAITTPINASGNTLVSIPGPVDGNWTGTTSLARAVTFTTGSTGTQWSTFALSTAFTTSGCSSASVTMTLTTPGPGSISSNAFSYTNGTSTYSFSGVFDTPYTAHGTYAFTNYRVFMSPTCNYYLYQTGTWTASTPMPPPGAFAKTSPTDGATSQPIILQLTWGSSANASSYDYCYGTTIPCDYWQTNGTATNVTLNDLTQNTTYYWNVRAVNNTAIIYSDGSTTNWSFTTGFLPGAFVKTAPSNGATSVTLNPTLTWGSSTNATGYEYCYDTTDDSACSSWTSNDSSTSVGLSGLSPSTTYYWQVRAKNTTGTTEANSGTGWSFTTGTPPAAFNKSSPSDGVTGMSLSPTLSWASSTNATSYEYCYDTTNDSTCSGWANVGSSTSLGLSSLSQYTTYYWQVRSNNSFGTTYANGSSNAYWSFTTGGVPGAFGKTSPNNGTTNVELNPTLNWASSTNATGYEYCYDTTNDSTCSGWTSTGTSTSVGLSGLGEYTTYYWHVRANNSFGTTYANGASTAFWSFTTGGAPGAFNKSSPSNGATSVVLNPTLSWESSTNATSYEYCYDTTNDGTCSNWTSNSTATSVSLTGLSQNTTYYWQVRASNSFGTTYANGASTAYWSFTTGGVPSAFSKTTPSDGATNALLDPILTWASSSGATGYEYCYDTSNDNACSGWADNGTSTSVGITGLDQYTTYFWHVRSNNGFGTTYADGSSTAYRSFTTGGVPGTFDKSSPSDGATNMGLSLLLSWGSSTNNTNYAYCYDSTNDGTCSNWTSNSTDTSVSLNGLSQYTTYYWQVRANNSFGTTYANGASTVFWSFTTGGTPGAFVKTSPSDGANGVSLSPTLTWASSNGATIYEYCYDISNDNVCNGWINTGTETSIDLSGLSPSTTYYWQAKSTNSFGDTYSNGSSTAFWSFTTGAPPAAFSKTSPANNALNRPANLTLKWAASIDAVEYVYCYDKSNDGKCGTGWKSAGTALSVAITNLAKATYYWQVRAKNANGDVTANGGTWWSFTVLPKPGVFGKTSPATNSINKPTTLTLYWAASSNAAKYEFCIKKSLSAPCTWKSTGTVRNVKLTGLLKNTKYYWQVRAKNVNGTTIANGGTWWNFTTKP